MPADHKTFSPAVLELLACPVCGGELRVAETRLRCVACGDAYPIVDGIPMLIPGRETGSAEQNKQ